LNGVQEIKRLEEFELKKVWFFVAVVLALACIVVSGCSKSEPKAGDVKINPKDGAEMVWVPAGEFLMGSTDEDIAQLLKKNPELEAARFDDEKPQRKVYLDGYWMYKYEVTVAQYRKFCEATNRKMPDAPSWGWKDDHPMVKVTWTDASNYAKWAGMSLPTEAQWEKAARGTDGRIYPWGNKWEAYKCNNRESGPKQTKPVGSYTSGASPYGCMDMAGNVWEWCLDWYGKDYYKSGPSRNPTGPTDGSSRVLRGGGWNGIDGSCRAAYRSHNPYPLFWSSSYGFRLCGSGA